VLFLRSLLVIQTVSLIWKLFSNVVILSQENGARDYDSFGSVVGFMDILPSHFIEMSNVAF
jgi:hypothetical protein